MNSILIITDTGGPQMQTRVEIDDNLVKEALKCSKAESLKELITQALREFIANHHDFRNTEITGPIATLIEGYD